MKPEELNPKAREAFGKSLIDIGVGIFKGNIFLFTAAPMTYLLKGMVDGALKNPSWSDFSVFIMSPGYAIFLLLWVFSVLLGESFRKEGLRHIHEIENSPVSNKTNEAPQ